MAFVAADAQQGVKHQFRTVPLIENTQCPCGADAGTELVIVAGIGYHNSIKQHGRLGNTGGIADQFHTPEQAFPFSRLHRFPFKSPSQPYLKPRSQRLDLVYRDHCLGSKRTEEPAAGHFGFGYGLRNLDGHEIGRQVKAAQAG